MRWVLPLVLLSASCNKKAPPPAEEPPVGGLTSEQSSRVLARVGEATITLGDLARALDRMDAFDRIRYQSTEKRRELLNEMIDLELLAQEAVKRGLDKGPEIEAGVRQIMRDAMLSEVRKNVPKPADFATGDLRAYYEAHKDRFIEPERRRVASIVLPDEASALRVLALAQKSQKPTEWGELFFSHSTNRSAVDKAQTPLDLAGDLGIVGPPSDAKGSNPKVPAALQEAIFDPALVKLGDILPRVVKDGGAFHVVRLAGKTEGHTRSFEEAERSIRVLLSQERLEAAEAAMDEELKKKFPVKINEEALKQLKVELGESP